MPASFFSLTAQSIRLTDDSNALLAELPLAFSVNSQAYRVTEIQENGEGWIGSTEDPGVTVAVRKADKSLCVELIGSFKGGVDVSYFVGSSITASHVHAFIPDDHLNTYPASEKRTFTLTNQAAMRQRLGLAEQLWMLAPQPHVIGVGTYEGAGFSFSIPECLTSDAVQFGLKDRQLQIDFLHYVADCDGGRLPRVYLDLGVQTKQESLVRHVAHARELGLMVTKGPQPKWWHNPLYCTWGDQCRLGQHGIDKNASLTPERILGWADAIRSFYPGEVNFIIDDGYFLGMGDFRFRPELYPTLESFQGLIAELKKRNFRVILWYTPFWVDKHAQIVTDHPEWLIRRRDGELLDETGDWKGKYHLDWTHPEMRDHQRKLIRHLLTELDADGFKIDMTYAYPPSRDIASHDPSWGAGNLLCKKAIEFIYNEAASIKPDVFLTVNGVESYLQPFASAVRLNDLFDFTNATAWYLRAQLVLDVMPGVAIDVDGWPAAPSKIREYPFVASVFGAPVTYYLDGTDVPNVTFGDAEKNRTASIWNTYHHSQVEDGQKIKIDVEAQIFERRDADGTLRAASFGKNTFIAFGETIRVTANADTAVAVPLERGRVVNSAERVNRDGSRISVPFYLDSGRALFFAEDAAKGILYYELA